MTSTDSIRVVVTRTRAKALVVRRRRLDPASVSSGERMSFDGHEAFGCSEVTKLVTTRM